MNHCPPAGQIVCLCLSLMIALTGAVGCRESVSKVPSAIDGNATTSKLKVLGEVPDFRLIDQSGDSFGSDQLDGTIWVATFIFTRCGATCPAQTAAFAELQKDLQARDQWGRVQLASFTVDPEFDTPEVLDKYGENVGADFTHWHFLTGSRGQLWDLSKEGFKLPVKSERDATTLVTHSQMFVLVDYQGKIRGYYDGLLPEANEKLRQDVASLLDEQGIEVSVPEDVRNPAWLADRAKRQIDGADESKVKNDFKFRDQLDRSGIKFKDEVVEDVKRLFKAAHYDHGSGVAVADVDGDERLDIYFVSQFGTNQLWKNLGEGKFEDVTESAGVGLSDEVSVAASFADVDNDGDADLYVTRIRAANKLFLNDGSGHFQDVSAASGLDHVGHSSGSVFFDYDRDGLLDLLLTNVGTFTSDQREPSGYYVAFQGAFSLHLHPSKAEESILFHNLGENRFENVNERLGFHDGSWSGDATPIDANEDGWPDIYLLNMQGHDEYYENQRGKKFVKKSRALFPATPWGAMGVKVFDYNRDGWLDLYVTDMHTDMIKDLDPDEEKSKLDRNLPVNMLGTDGNHVLGNAFYQKVGADQFREVSDEINAENYWPWGISVADLNADGFEDVFITASMNYPYRYGINSLLLNDHGQRFVDSEFILAVEPRSSGTAQPWMRLEAKGDGEDSGLPPFADYDDNLLVWAAKGSRSSVIFDVEGDGDLDIVTNDFGGTPMVLISDLSDTSEIHFLNVQLMGTKSNRDGLGAQVKIQIADKTLLSVHDGKSGYLSQSRMPLYFGLADSTTVDRIEVTWPSGTKQIVEGPIQSNQTLTITEQSNP